MNNIKKYLETYCELYWWNGGRKTLDFKGTLKDLLESYSLTYRKRVTDRDGIYTFYFNNTSGIKWKTTGIINDFPFLAKQFLQMELVRMGDKSKLYVSGVWRSTVTVNF